MKLLEAKTCSKCRVSKPLSEFWKDNRPGRSYMARCKACKHAAVTQYRKNNPGLDRRRYWANRDSERERHLVRKYGITLAVYATMLDAQNGRCAICKRPEPADKLFDVDHDHITGVVRGLLCTSCNRMIGHAGDNCETLRAAADYLELSRKSRRNS